MKPIVRSSGSTSRLVHGGVPVEVSLQRGDQPEPAIKLPADLTNDEIVLDHLQWHKPAGRAATVDSESSRAKTATPELQNLKVVSDDIAAEGTVGVGADDRMKEFAFSEFHAQRRVEPRYARQSAARTTFGRSRSRGRTMMAAAFSDRYSTSAAVPMGKAKLLRGVGQGARVNVEIDNVIGGSDVSLRNLKMQLETRGTSLDA